MKITVKETKENPLLKRKELEGIIEHDGLPTPSKAAVQKVLAKNLKEKENHVDIRKVFTGMGKTNSRLIAFIWKEKEVPVLEELAKAEKKEAEKKAEAPKPEEKPAEEPKKEPVKEAKPEEDEKKEPEKKEEPKKEQKKEEKPKE